MSVHEMSQLPPPSAFSHRLHEHMPGLTVQEALQEERQLLRSGHIFLALAHPNEDVSYTIYPYRQDTLHLSPENGAFAITIATTRAVGARIGKGALTDSVTPVAGTNKGLLLGGKVPALLTEVEIENAHIQVDDLPTADTPLVVRFLPARPAAMHIAFKDFCLISKLDIDQRGKLVRHNEQGLAPFWGLPPGLREVNRRTTLPHLGRMSLPSAWIEGIS